MIITSNDIQMLFDKLSYFNTSGFQKFAVVAQKLNWLSRGDPGLYLQGKPGQSQRPKPKPRGRNTAPATLARQTVAQGKRQEAAATWWPVATQTIIAQGRALARKEILGFVITSGAPAFLEENQCIFREFLNSLPPECVRRYPNRGRPRKTPATPDVK